MVLITCLGICAAGCQPTSTTTTTPVDITLSDQALLDIHDTIGSDEALFAFARSVTRLRNGTIVVADQYARGLKFFNDSGESTKVVGRRGRGPGEFEDVTWVSTCGRDSIYAFDYTRRMVLVFDTAGSFAREFRPEGNPHEMRCSASGILAVLGLPYGLGSSQQPPEHLVSPVLVLNMQGQSLVRIGDVPFAENGPLGKRTHIAVSDDGIYVGTADSAAVVLYSLDGSSQTALRANIVNVTPTAANLKAAIDETVSYASNAAVRELQRPQFESMAVPEFVPLYRQVLVDTRRIVWLVVSPLGEPFTKVQGLIPDDSSVVTLRLPPDATIQEIGEDYLLAIHQDSIGFQHVLLFDLRRQ